MAKKKQFNGFKKGEWSDISHALIAAAVFAVLAAGWGFLVSDFILASTQWLLVAAVLILFGIWAKMES